MSSVSKIFFEEGIRQTIDRGAELVANPGSMLPIHYGRHVVTAAEATANTLTIKTGKANANWIQATILRAGNVVTADADFTFSGTAGNIVIADGSTLNLTAGDVIMWAVGKCNSTPLAAPVITTNGGGGAGVSYSTAVAALTLTGTCSAETDTIVVTGRAGTVDYTPGDTAWTFTATLASGANALTVVAKDYWGNSSASDTITVTLT